MSEKRLSAEEYIAEKERRRAAKLIVRGDTYRFRDTIKQLDGMFDRMQQYWLMPNAEALAAIIRECGGVPQDGFVEIPRRTMEKKKP